MRALETVGAEAATARWHPITLTPSAMPASTTPAQAGHPISRASTAVADCVAIPGAGAARVRRLPGGLRCAEQRVMCEVGITFFNGA